MGLCLYLDYFTYLKFSSRGGFQCQIVAFSLSVHLCFYCHSPAHHAQPQKILSLQMSKALRLLRLLTPLRRWMILNRSQQFHLSRQGMDRLCHLIRAFMKRKLSMKIRVVFFTQIRFSKSESIYVEHLTAHMTMKVALPTFQHQAALTRQCF